MASKTHVLTTDEFHIGMKQDEFEAKKKMLSEIEVAVFDLLLRSDHAMNTREIRNTIIDDFFKQLFYGEKSKYIDCKSNASKSEGEGVRKKYKKKKRDEDLRAIDVEKFKEKSVKSFGQKIPSYETILNALKALEVLELVKKRKVKGRAKALWAISPPIYLIWKRAKNQN